MRATYRVISFIICALVAVQAAAHAWASAGLALYISEGGVIDMTSDGPPPFPEVMGFIVHSMNGMFVIPILAIVLVIISFFAKIPKGTLWAVIVLVVVLLQVTLGIFGHGITFLGLLHGINALVLFTVALLAGLRASKSRVEAGAAAPAGVAV